MDQVVWVSGRTRRFGIVGDPITQVRPLQFVSAECAKRGPAAILIPIPGAISVHALPSTSGRVDRVWWCRRARPCWTAPICCPTRR